MIWPVIAVAVLLINTIASWSDRLVDLISGDGDGGPSRLPQWLVAILEARPDTGDAEIHAAMWAVAAFAVAMAVRSTRRRNLALGALLAWSAIVEVLQPVITTRRSFQWTDLVGNAVGVALGAAAVMVWRHRARIFPLPAWARWSVVAAVLGGVVYSMWSLRIMDWWAEVSSDDANPLVQLRPDTNEADLHAVVWFTISLLVVWAIGLRATVAGAWRRWATALVVVFAVSWLIEWIQPQLSFRRYNTVDVVGNAIGVALAAVVCTVAMWRVRRRSARPDHEPGGQHPQRDAETFADTETR